MEELKTVSVLSWSSRQLFAKQDCDTRHRPAATTLQRRWQRSSLRSAQRRSAHTVSLLGAVPLPLGDVGRKTKGIPTTHTVRAQSHWHGHCRITQTAGAPWSCNSSIASPASIQVQFRGAADKYQASRLVDCRRLRVLLMSAFRRRASTASSS